MQKLTAEQSAIIGAFTGICCGPFSEVHKYAERKLDRSIWTHQFPEIADELKEASRSDFLDICYRSAS